MPTWISEKDVSLPIPADNIRQQLKTVFDEKAVYKTTGWEDLKGNGDSNSKLLYVEILEYMCNCVT